MLEGTVGTLGEIGVPVTPGNGSSIYVAQVGPKTIGPE